MYYIIKPPVCGEFGSETVRDATLIPHSYAYVHFVFDRWPDDLVASHPVFIVTKNLASKLLESNCTGFFTEPCKVSKSEYFDYEDHSINAKLPEFVRLIIFGIPHKDDVSLDDYELMLSEKAYELVQSFDCGASFIIEVPDKS